MNNGPSLHEFWEWVRSLPANLGRTGISFYLLGFILLIISGICALLVNIIPLDIVWRILGVGLAVMSLGVGLISLGAAYKSSTAVKAVGYSEGKTEEQLKVDVGEGITLEKGGLSADVDETKVDSKDIKDIIERLGRIEKQQVEHGKGSEQHLLIGLGFSSVVIGSTFIITTSNFGGGISIILAGIGVVLVAYFGKPFRKR